MTTTFYDQINELDRIIQMGPSVCDYAKDVEPLVGDGAAQRYFFDHLDDPAWIDVLYRAGVHRQTPEPEPGLPVPVWGLTRYLVRMTDRAPLAVIALATRIPYSRNPLIYADLVDIALKLPADLAIALIPAALEWLDEPRGYLSPDKLAQLIDHLVGDGRIEPALTVARALLKLQPGRRAEMHKSPPGSSLHEGGDEGAPAFKAEPLASFDLYHYESLLTSHIPILVSAAGTSAFKLLCDTLAEADRLSYGTNSDTFTDLSYSWRPAVEEHRQNSPSGIRGLLVSAVRDGAELLIAENKVPVGDAVRICESYRWHIFLRIALHILRHFPNAAFNLIVERLKDRQYFDSIDFRHEYALLVGEQFKNLSQHDQDVILAFIDDGPNVERYVQSFEKWAKRPVTDTDVAQYVATWRRDHLAPFATDLPPHWKGRFQALVHDRGQPEHPEFVTYWSSLSGPTAPTTVEGLRGLSTDQLIRYLKEWHAPKGQLEPSYEGLGQVLSMLVSEDPQRFVSRAGAFRVLEPTYVRALIYGLHQALSKKLSFAWPDVLELCTWIVGQPRGMEDNAGDLYRDRGWGPTRHEIARLLSLGLENPNSSDIPVDLRRFVWPVLMPLTSDPDPTEEDDRRFGPPNMSPAALSINTVRGEAMHATIRYARWLRRHGEANETVASGEVREGIEKSIAATFEVLDEHLIPSVDPSPAIRSVYGQWLPYLMSLDETWTMQRLARIFPQDEEYRPLHDAAWRSYLTFNTVYDKIFVALQDEYRRAVNDIAGTRSEEMSDGVNPQERLAEHLMILYWRGRITFDEPSQVLDHFVRSAGTELTSHAVEFVGRVLGAYQETSKPEVQDRLRQLWTRYFEDAQTKIKQGDAAASRRITPFGWWFASKYIDVEGEWSLQQFRDVLELTGGSIDPSYAVIEQLARVALVSPDHAIECLTMLLERNDQRMGFEPWTDNIRSTLTTALNSASSTAQQRAITLINELGKRNDLSYRTLLP